MRTNEKICITHYNIISACRSFHNIGDASYKRSSLIMLKNCDTRLALNDCLSYSDTNKRRMFSEARLRLSYALSEFLQAVGCILELTKIRQPHSACRSHIFTFTYKGTYG
jgi:hypothetical protein